MPDMPDFFIFNIGCDLFDAPEHAGHEIAFGRAESHAVALRRRIEGTGGSMQEESTPRFRLVITLPGKEETP